jgi:nucleoside-diphosphate-sugar epimerase
MTDSTSKIEKKRVSILGCGWLGFALAQRIRETDSTWIVKGSTTSPEKLPEFSANNIQGFVLPLSPGFVSPGEDVRAFFDSDVLIISLPPRLSKNEPGFYPDQIRAVVSAVQTSPVQEIILISSTGIYPDLSREMIEADVTLPEESASPEMVTAENLAASLRPDKRVSILRLGGLLGYNRNPGKYVIGKKDLETASIPVNYIHRDDAAAIILHILQSGIQDETFNIVCPLHPTRREVYESACARFGWEAPTFKYTEISPAFKIISSQKFRETYSSFEYLVPDPLTFYYSS